MKIIKTANYEDLKRRLEDARLRDFSTTIPLINDETGQLEDVEVNVAYSPKMRGNGWSVNVVEDAITKEDLTDLVYDSVNKDIMNKLLSEINEIAGNMASDAYEDEAYDQATYEAEMGMQDYKQYGDGYQVEDTSPCVDPIDRPRTPTKRKDEQSYDNIEPKNMYNDTL